MLLWRWVRKSGSLPGGYRQVVRIMLYAGQAGLAQADVWANALIAGLHREPVTGAGEDTSTFTAHYLGVRDAEKLDTVTGTLIERFVLACMCLRRKVVWLFQQAVLHSRKSGWARWSAGRRSNWAKRGRYTPTHGPHSRGGKRYYGG